MLKVQIPVVIIKPCLNVLAYEHTLREGSRMSFRRLQALDESVVVTRCAFLAKSDYSACLLNAFVTTLDVLSCEVLPVLDLVDVSGYDK